MTYTNVQVCMLQKMYIYNNFAVHAVVWRFINWRYCASKNKYLIRARNDDTWVRWRFGRVSITCIFFSTLNVFHSWNGFLFSSNNDTWPFSTIRMRVKIILFTLKDHYSEALVKTPECLNIRGFSELSISHDSLISKFNYNS